MIKAFVDTNVCLDLICGRKPFNASAEKLFSLADAGKIKLFVSAISFANMEYILKSQYKIDDARKALSRFKVLVSVLPLDDKIIELSIGAGFKDFEDAIQYYTAIEMGLKILITRDLRGYAKTDLRVIDPEGFISSL
jgi:predicted nucleic acid-binding protein